MLMRKAWIGVALAAVLLAAGCGGDDSTTTEGTDAAQATTEVDATQVIFDLLPVEAAARKAQPGAVTSALGKCEAGSPETGDRFRCFANYLTDSARSLRGAAESAEATTEQIGAGGCKQSAEAFLSASKRVADELRAVEEATLNGGAGLDSALDSLYREANAASELDQQVASSCR